MIKISASLMCADLCNLSKEIEILEKLGIDIFHFDIAESYCRYVQMDKKVII